MRPAEAWLSGAIPSEYKKEHPDRAGLFDAWKLARDAYSACGGFLSGEYIEPFPAELKRALMGKVNKLEIRKRLAKNHIPRGFGTCVDKYVSYLTQEPPILSIDKGGVNLLATRDDLKLFMEDADGNGSTFADMHSNIITNSLTAGAHLALIDMPTIQDGEAATNERDRLSKRQIPYIALIPIEHLMDFEADKMGQLIWARLATGFDGIGLPNQYRVWARNFWVDLDKSFVPGLPVPHPVGRVPICIYSANFMQPGRAFVQSPLQNIARYDKDEYNAQSELTQIRRDCAYPVRYGPKLDEGKADLGSTEWIGVETGDTTPGQITADVGAIDALLRIIENIQSKKADESGIPEMSGQPVEESGVARSYRFRLLEKSLSGIASMLRKPTTDMLYYVMRWIEGPGAEAYTYRATYPSAFDVKSVEDDFNTLTELRALGYAPPTLEQELVKRIAAKSLPQGSEKLLEDIAWELENNSMERASQMRGRTKIGLVDKPARL